MNPTELNKPFIPTQITTGSYLQTVNHYNVSINEASSYDYIGYLVQTHCPEKPQEKMISNIDLIKVVFHKKSADKIKQIKALLTVYLRQIGIAVSTKKATLRHHKNGNKLFSLDETHNGCGSIKWDIDKGILQLWLSGNGCQYVNASLQKWQPIYALLKQYTGKITEVDIAVDDYSGKFNLRYLQKAYSAGDYNPAKGARPVRNPKEKHKGTEYLGSSDSAKSLCVYEKWRELKLAKVHPLYGLWTRHEVTWRRKNNHVISEDVLLKSDDYFVGAYPKVHKRIIKTATPRCPKREVALERTNSFSRTVASARHQYGPTFGSCIKLLGDSEAASTLFSREGSPKSLKLPKFINEVTLKESVSEYCGTTFNEHFVELVLSHDKSKCCSSERRA